MIAFLIDADNLSSPDWIEEAFERLKKEASSISVRRAYGSAENLKGLASVLLAHAVRPFVNLSLAKNTTDMALAVDAMELCCSTPGLTTVVIGSGDSDFLPVVVRLRERGIRMVCISRQGKMSVDAVNWYDQIHMVGAEAEIGTTQAIAAAISADRPGRPAVIDKPAKKSVAKKTPVAKKSAVKAVAKVAAKPNPVAVPKAKVDSQSKTTVSDILAAAPKLASGEFQSLGDVVKLLHDKKLLGKNTSSPKWFAKYPHHFELLPARQPNRIRFILPPT